MTENSITVNINKTVRTTLNALTKSYLKLYKQDSESLEVIKAMIRENWSKPKNIEWMEHVFALKVY